MLMCSTAIVISYLNTFELGRDLAATLLFAFVVHMAYHCYMYWGLPASGSTTVSAALLSSFLAVPMLILLHIGISIWRDEEFFLPPPKVTIASGALFLVCIVACIILLYVYVNRVAAICGVVLLVLIALAGSTLYAYRTHGSHLPKRFIVVREHAIVILLALAGIWAAFAHQQPQGFVGFTISWLGLAVSLVVSAVVQLMFGDGALGSHHLNLASECSTADSLSYEGVLCWYMIACPAVVCRIVCRCLLRSCTLDR